LNEYSFVTAFASLVAAFFGAICAFALNNTLEKKKSQNLNIANANEALITLVQMNKTLDFIDISTIRNYRLDNMYWLLMPSQDLYANKQLNLNLRNLVFLIEYNEVKFLAKLAELEESFHKIVMIYERRHLLHEEYIAPVKKLIIEDMNSQIKQANSESNYRLNFDLDKYIDGRKMKEFIELTDGLVFLNDIARTDFEDMLQTLPKVLKICFPQDNFVSLNPNTSPV